MSTSCPTFHDVYRITASVDDCGQNLIRTNICSLDLHTRINFDRPKPTVEFSNRKNSTNDSARSRKETYEKILHIAPCLTPAACAPMEWSRRRNVMGVAVPALVRNYSPLKTHV